VTLQKTAETVAAAFELVKSALTLVETATAGPTPAFIKAHLGIVFRISSSVVVMSRSVPPDCGSGQAVAGHPVINSP
jgi:hypothetical protein